MAVCPHCHRENPVISAYCPACGGEMSPQGEPVVVSSPRPVILPKAQHGMKWYKFLTFFSLPLSLIAAVSNLFDTLSALREYDPALYMPGLEHAVYVNLIATLCLTLPMLVLIVLSEWNLFRFRWTGVKCLLGNYVINCIYALAMAVVMLQAPAESGSQAARVASQYTWQFFTSAAGMLLMFFLNRRYFNKRRGFFEPDKM